MRGLTIPAIATVLMCAAMWFQSLTPEPSVAEAPAVEIRDVPGFSVTELEPGEAELTVLPADTQFIKRLYTAPNGLWFQVTAVIGGSSKSSIHRPELCLPAQGFQMVRPRDVSVCGLDWRVMSLERNYSSPLGFAYTFFNQRGVRTASHVRRILTDVWDRSFCGRIDRWVMITVSSTGCDEGGFGEFLAALKEAVE